MRCISKVLIWISSGDKTFDAKLSWLRQLLEWHQDMSDSRDFVNTVKMDVFADEVFVFTPRGDVIDLPVGAVPIDFAYRIHTDVGNRCVGAKVNGRIVPLDYKLSNGDIVVVITSKQAAGPSRDWLNIVGSSDVLQFITFQQNLGVITQTFAFLFQHFAAFDDILLTPLLLEPGFDGDYRLWRDHAQQCDV